MVEESEDGEETGDVDKDGDKEDEEAAAAFEWLESLFVFLFSLDDADLKRFKRE